MAVVLAACGAPEAVVDAGADGGGADAGTADAGTADAGGVDAGRPDAGEGEVGRFEVTRVAFELDLPARRVETTLSLRRRTDGGCVVLDSPPVEWARFGDTPASARLEGSRLTACGAPPGEELELTTANSLDAPPAPGTDQGFAVRQGLVGRFTSLLAWVGGCGRLVTCDARADLLTPLRFGVHHGLDEQVLCPGAVTVDAGFTRCVLDAPAPSYSGFLVLAATGWSSARLVDADAGVVTVSDAAAGAVRASLDPDAVRAALDWFTAALGPLPYGRELRIATGPMAWLGFEGPGLIMFNEATPGLMLPWSAPSLHIFAHELGHQWAGDRTTLLEPAEFSLKEALAEYLVWRFERAVAPSRARETRLLWRRGARFAATFPRPTGALPPLLLLGSDGMAMGPMVLVQLEDLLGEAVVFEAVREVLAQPGTMSWAGLQAVLERRSGLALGGYFRAWVFGDGEPAWPQLDAQAVQTSSGWVLEVTQRQAAGPFPLRLAVEVTSVAGGTVVVEAVFPVVGTPRVVRVPVSGQPVGWTLDPETRVVWLPVLPPLVGEVPPPRWVF